MTRLAVAHGIFREGRRRVWIGKFEFPLAASSLVVKIRSWGRGSAGESEELEVLSLSCIGSKRLGRVADTRE